MKIVVPNEMIVLFILLTLVICFQLFSSQEVITDTSTITISIPEDCQSLPGNVQVDDCCKILPVFDEKTYLECSFKNFDAMDPSDKIPRIATDPNCAKYFCVLEKNNIAENGTIDYDNLNNFLDKYGKDHPDLNSTVHYAKLACIEKNISFKGIDMCEATAVTACLMSSFFAECPGWDKSTECQNLFNHLGQCNMFLMKKLEEEEKQSILRTATIKDDEVII